LSLNGDKKMSDRNIGYHNKEKALIKLFVEKGWDLTPIIKSIERRAKGEYDYIKKECGLRVF